MLLSIFCTQNNVFEVSTRGSGGGELSLSSCPGAGNKLPSTKKSQTPRGMPGGWMVTGRIEPYIIIVTYKCIFLLEFAGFSIERVAFR